MKLGNLHGLGSIRSSRTQLNTIDYGNPLPRDLDPALLWPGPQAEQCCHHPPPTTHHRSRCRRPNQPVGRWVLRAQGHSPGTARRTKPGFQDKPRLRLTGTSSVDSWLLATRCSGLEGHGLRIHREKSVRSAFPGQRWILPASACWHMSSQFLFRRRCTMCDSGPEPHPCHTVNANPSASGPHTK